MSADAALPLTLPPWIEIAAKELGAAEIAGKSHNPRIIEYHSTTTLKATDDETPWCSAFVNWCMTRAGLRGTRSAAARSWLTWGSRITWPAFGCIAVMSRGRNSSQGHVGFWVGFDGSGMIRLLGGNQGDKVSISTFQKSQLLSYRWP